MTPQIPSTRRLPQLTGRDVAILRDLFDSRILTARQIADIHFGGSGDAARQRLPRLKSARLIASRSTGRAYEPDVLFLAKAGFDLLRDSNELADFPSLDWLAMEKRLRVSDATFDHELHVGTFKAAFHAAARGREHTAVIDFLTWPQLFKFTTRRSLAGGYSKAVQIKADAFARVRSKDDRGDVEHAFYVEVDRSTETLDRIVARGAGYVSHYQSGNFAKWMGGDGSDPAAYPFRVLWVFKSQQRLLNFARGCMNSRPPIRRMMWLAVFDEAASDPFGPVWTTPADCPTEGVSAAWSPSMIEGIERKLLL